MNICFLVGNLTKDPQRINNTQMVRLNLAVNDSYTKADGTRPTDYFNVIVWGKIADTCEKYLSKGKKISVTGKMQNRAYEKDGQKRYRFEIIATDIEFLSPKAEPKAVEQDPIWEEYDEDCPF